MRNSQLRIYQFLFIVFFSVLCIMAAGAAQLGDVNADNATNILDALLVAKYAAGLNPGDFQIAYADVNCSGKVDVLDALVIARYSAGIINTFVCSPSPTPTSTQTNTCLPCVVNLKGYVKDAVTGSPIAGASVEMHLGIYGGYTTTITDANGYYSVTGPTCHLQEPVSITVTKTGYNIWGLGRVLYCSSANTQEIILTSLNTTPTATPTATPTRTPTNTPTRTPSPVIIYPTLIPGHIINVATGKLLTMSSTNVVQRTINTPSFGNNNQNWGYISQPLNYYAIVNNQTGKALTVENASLEPGAYVISGDLAGSDAAKHQQWQFVHLPNGYFMITNINSGLNLTIENASIEEEAKLIQAKYVEGASEFFWTTVEAAPQPCPTCCDYSGAFCIRTVNNVVVKENSTEPAEIKITAGRLLLGPQPTAYKGSNIVVNYTLKGTAANGIDAEYLNGQVLVYANNYPDGDTNSPPGDGIIRIMPLDDLVNEGCETLRIELSYPGAAVTNNGMVYILDDETVY